MPARPKSAHSLMDSLASEDVLGVVDLLLPGERDTMRQPLIDFVDHLKRLEGRRQSRQTSTRSAASTSSFDDVQVETTATNVDDISDIHITATGTASVDGDDSADRQSVDRRGIRREAPRPRQRAADNPTSTGTSRRSSTTAVGTSSAFYSIAENARKGVRRHSRRRRRAERLDTPEGAVQAVFDAVDRPRSRRPDRCAQPERGRGTAALCADVPRRRATTASTTPIRASRSPT